MAISGLLALAILGGNAQQATPAASPEPAPTASPPRTAPVPPPAAADAEVAAVSRAEAVTLDLDEPSMTLGGFLAEVSRQASMPCVADWDELASIAIDPDETVDARFAKSSLLASLDAVAATLGSAVERPRFELLGGRILLTSPAGAEALRFGRLYPAGAKAESLLGLIVDAVDPEGWLEVGGGRQHGSIHEDAILVVATARTHRRIEEFLDQWRQTHPHAIRVEATFVRVPVSAAPADFAAALRSGGEILSRPSVTSGVGQAAAMVWEAPPSSGAIKLLAGLSEDGSGFTVAGHLQYASGDDTAESDFLLPFPFGGGRSTLAIPMGKSTLVVQLDAAPVGGSEGPESRQAVSR